MKEKRQPVRQQHLLQGAACYYSRPRDAYPHAPHCIHQCRYAVIPLSPNSGLIGWVPNTDTLHALIREYREGRKIPLNVEHRLMMGMAPDHDHLTVIQKVEVFEHALDSTSGEDLHKVWRV